MQTTDRICAVCHRQFVASARKVREGKGIYCSKSCATRARHGNLTLAERFWMKVDKSGECWLWTGAKTPSGYGSFQLGVGQGATTAQRVAYELSFGPIPQGMFVCHHCDNPPCVRPDHLFAGTVGDNNRDMFAKERDISHTKRDRLARGERQHLAKLTADDVREIRRRYTPGNGPRLAQEFGITNTTLHDVLSGKTWKHVQ